MVKVGIIGCGTIGSKLAVYIDSTLKGKAELAFLSDIDRARAEKLSSSLASRPAVVGADELIRSSGLVIEAASASISADIAKKALANGRDVMIMSTGGLLKGYRSIFGLSEEKKARLYLPSGAISGLDGLKAAMLAGVDKVTLTTTKPPKGFTGAPYVVRNKIDLDSIKSDKVLFEGDAYGAMEGFPANINVAATLSVCGTGPENTKVRIIASPSAKRNIHEIEAEGAFGKLVARTENIPSPDNPKTSYMAVLSAMAVLRGIFEDVRVGT